MADTMRFELVSPERRLALVEARMAQIPGADGDLTAMPNHAPLVTSLRPGVLKVDAVDGVSEFFVTGGFAEITGTATTVLAESAAPREEVTSEMIDLRLEEARKRAELAEGESAIVARQEVMDLEWAREHLL